MTEPCDLSGRPRYVVGIDLGTTNSAVGFIDTQASSPVITTFEVLQTAAAGQVERFETLPSFHYEALPDERAAGVTKLPWSQDVPKGTVGSFARDHGRSLPGRMIESAKSWLCHNGVDRRAALLPWHSAEDVERLSPVEASARYLRHIKEAWNFAYPNDPLDQQDVVLTIPASFDEIARELTVTAARLAGLPKLVLIEEPQAAFYSWVDAHRDDWEHIVSPGQRILVCDIGGGTSDFSLIHVRSGDDGRIRFHRVAVGEHLLLGGDNLDLALAHFVERKLAEEREGLQLSPRQWSQLIPACRHAKEVLLSSRAPDHHNLVIGGGGSRLIGGAISVSLSRDEVTRLFLDGFLPEVSLDARPQRRQSGFQEFGLPFAPDAAITKYLAAFLAAHGEEDAPVRPDVVLFNGGFFASPILRDRLIATLERWFSAAGSLTNGLDLEAERREPSGDCLLETQETDTGRLAPCRFLAAKSTPLGSWSPVVLRNDRLDLAVARGAAYFGLARRGIGIRIVAGLAQTYYVGIEQADGQRAAVCLVAAGTEAGATAVVLDQVFRVRTSEPVEFPIFVSGTRLNDKPGDIVPFDPEQLRSLPPIRTVLTSRKRDGAREVGAQLSAALTEIGTLELWCLQTDGSRKWQLQFDVRPATQTDRETHGGVAEQAGIVDQELVDVAAGVVRDVFGPDASVRPDDLVRRLSEAVDLPRAEWPASLLRAIHAELLHYESGRARSAQHEARWLNLAGYCLRPGFGMAADDWRVEETWKAINGRLIHAGPACLAELRTLCRRLSGGFTASRQRQIAATVLPAIRQRVRQAQTGRGKAALYASGNHEASEIWRMLGSFELLDPVSRRELGEIALDLMNRPAFEPVRPALIWLLGRVGSRVPVYGPLNLVIAADVIEPWIESLLTTGDSREPGVQLALMQLCRRTHDRHRDVAASLRSRVVTFLQAAGAGLHLATLVADGGSLDDEEAGRIAGEALPAGLRLV